MTVWLPGYTVIELGPSGGPYDTHDNPKLVWHTTEGSSLAGAETAFAPYPPHLGVDPRTGEKHQYISLDRSAYSLGHSDAEDSWAIQVEVVGYAGQSHTWGADILDWLGIHVAAPVAHAVGVPPVHLVFYGEDDGIILASPDSPIRMSLGQWDSFAGHVGHQHCPGDDHWDPGRLDVGAILTAAEHATPTVTAPSSSEDTTMAVVTAPGRVDLFVVGTDHHVYQATGRDQASLARSGWLLIGGAGTYAKTVSAAWTPDYKLLYLTVQGSDDHPYTCHWDEMAGGWSPFDGNEAGTMTPDPYETVRE